MFEKIQHIKKHQQNLVFENILSFCRNMLVANLFDSPYYLQKMTRLSKYEYIT